MPTRRVISEIADRRRRAGLERSTRRLLVGWVLPTWILAGLADWQCHRRSDIEHTAGTREALIHAVMMGEAGIPVLMGLFCEVNAGVLAVVLGALGLHQATAAWDVSYAESRRKVTATEQHIHGLLEQAPAMAAATLMTLHWDQARALLPGTHERPRFAPRSKRQPLSPAVRAAVIGAIVVFGAVPYTEEVMRCRAASSGSTESR